MSAPLSGDAYRKTLLKRGISYLLRQPTVLNCENIKA
jgi:hypothetical protein